MREPDLYLELDESVINEAMAAGWQTGLATAKGTIDLAGNLPETIPEALKTMARADWRVTLNGEPLLDFRPPDRLFLRCDAELELMILTKLSLKFDAALSVECGIQVDAGKDAITFKPRLVRWDRLVVRDHVQISDAFLQRLNTLLATAMQVYLTEERLPRDLPEIRYAALLPGLPDKPENRLPLLAGDIALFSGKKMAAGLHLFDSTRTDFSNHIPRAKAPIFLRIRQETLHRVYDFWWDRTDRKTSFPFEGSMPLNAKALLEKGTNLLTRILTAGFLQRDIRMENIRLTYTGQASLLDKPAFELTAPANAALTGLRLQVVLDVQVIAEVDDTWSFDTSGPIPDKLTPWQDDVKLSNRKETRTILHLKETVEVRAARTAAALNVTEGSAIGVKALAADILIELGSKWYETLPENLLNGLIKLFNKRILESLPVFSLSPATLLHDVKIKGMTPVVLPETLSFKEDAIEIGLGVEVAELPGGAQVPGYVANLHSRRVHRLGCAVVGDIRQEHRTGYFVLHEALRDGFTACKSCLKGAEVK